MPREQRRHRFQTMLGLKIDDTVELAQGLPVHPLGLGLELFPNEKEADDVEAERGDPREVVADLSEIERLPHRHCAATRPVVDSGEKARHGARLLRFEQSQFPVSAEPSGLEHLPCSATLRSESRLFFEEPSMPPLVGIIMGSRSDLTTMREAANVLSELGIPHEMRIVSAHRTPDLMFRYAESARERGLRVIIAGAGGAAHLPGMTAAKTMLPVIGVPIQS